MNIQSANDELEYALLTSWLDTADIGLCVADQEGRAVMVNAAACSALGISKLSVLNISLPSLFREFDDPERLLEWIASPPGDTGLQVNRRTNLGNLAFLLKKQAVSHRNGERFTIISFTDVSALLDAQRRIAEKDGQEQLKRQWQALFAGVVIVDALLPDMPIVYINNMFERMSGYTSEEVLGRNCKFLQGTESDQPALEDIRRAIKMETNGYAVLRNYRKDGSLFINELFISPVRNNDGKVIQFIGIQHVRSPA